MTNTRFDAEWRHAKEEKPSKDSEIVEHGWEQHVLIDHENGLVYRYPRNASAAAKLADEVGLLAELNKQDWPVQIPLMREHNEHYSVYNFIEGEVLTEENIAKISDSQMEDIGTSIGTFLAHLHQADKEIVERKNTKQTMSLHEYYKRRIWAGQESEYFKDALKDLESLGTPDPSSQVVVHGDLHGLNTVINPDTKELAGIIDFSEVEIGDPHQDFRKPFMTDERLLEPAVLAYRQAGGRTLSINIIKLWAYVNEWANICYYRQQTENPTYKRALKNLKKWGQLTS